MGNKTASNVYCILQLNKSFKNKDMFGAQKVITKSSIKAKAEGALSLFRTAINGLKASSEEAVGLHTTNEVAIETLNTENKELSELMSDNQRVIDNISKLID